MTDELTPSTLKTYFRFPFSGPENRSRLLTGMGITLASLFLPLLPLLAIEGYCLRIMRRTGAGGEPVLPDWDDWGGLVRDGLKFFVVQLLYLLPAYALMIAGMVVYFVSFFFIPLFLAMAETSGRVNDPAVGALMGVLMFVSMGVLFLSLALGMLCLLLGALPMPVALARLAVTGQIKEALRLRQVLALLKANRLGWLIAWVVASGLLYLSMLAAMIFYYSLVLICLAPLLLAPCMFLTAVIASALFGESYHRAAATLELPE